MPPKTNPPRLPKGRRYHWYAIFLFIMGTLFPPLGTRSPVLHVNHTCSLALPPAVAARFGIGKDFWLNLLLTIAGYIPGHVHNFYIQNVRNNKTHHRTPKWALRYGLVNGSTIKRHEQRSQWAGRYHDRNPDSGYDQQPLEDGQVGPSRTPTHGSADNSLRNGDGLWRPDDESYYSAEREGSLQTSESGGRWRYPANFNDSLPGAGDTTTRKKKKKDRWARTEDAYSVSGQKKRKKKSKNRPTMGDAADGDSTYSHRTESTAERELPEEATRVAYEGGEEGNTRTGLVAAMVSAFKAFALFLGATSATCANAQVLVDFQVAEPPPVPSDAQTCTTMILDPPTNCGEPGSWAAVTLNFTVTSNGTQYDRLGVFTFQNTEIWRTSTPEPTHDGIIWTYTKDVTRYIPLFAKPGTFILELNNILNPQLNGQYATTLYATFYTASQEYPTAGQSNLIVPISTMLNNTADDASVPPAFSLNVTLPRNTVEIYAELYASGGSDEEFWVGHFSPVACFSSAELLDVQYYNTADEYLGDLPAGTTYGGGPFREVRLLVDGQVAGVAFPYPVIFTGGINPSVWRPITSYGALDLPTYFLDLTPFAPTFSDGLAHNVTLDVASAEANHTLNQNWYVSGLLQVVTDPSGQPTTGGITCYDVQPYAVTETSASIGGTDVNITVKAQRSLHIEAVVINGSGQENYVVFQQNLDYTNTQYYLNNTNTQNVAQVSLGSVSSLHNGASAVVDDFEYPLYINMSYLEITNTSETFYTAFDHSYNRQVLPAPFLLGSTISERQQTAGYFTISTTSNGGNGTSNNTFAYTDTKGNTYDREVDAAYNVIIYDQQSGSLASTTLSPPISSTTNAQNVPAARLPGSKQLRIIGWMWLFLININH
ncbi:peptide N-acetyl-beta-D-glucosaminyl asparaginase amidase A-domain-containing protein [Lanmaoa asiatica]|nr:peptide N-acetyl-beta-D-glucosaminyl asparaginase amidase A-domain-containing protein [Lanmaoa asiatica]